MLKRTGELKCALQNCKTLGEKLQHLENVFSGETAYIVTCGPTLGALDHPRLKKKLENKLVIAVKQAFDVVREAADFHVFNWVSLKPYDYRKAPNVIRLTLRDTPNQSLCGNPEEIACLLDPHTYPSSESAGIPIAKTLDFSQYLFSKSELRSWGPGVMYEAVFFLALHLGVKKCVTIAWDLPAPEKPYEHFYPEKKDWTLLDRALCKSAGLLDRILMKKRRLEEKECGHRPGALSLRTRTEVALGRLLNPPCPYAGELEDLQHSARFIHQWLGGQGVEYSALTNYEHLPSEIPRVRLEDL